MDRSLLEFGPARTAGKVILAFTGGYRRLWVNPLMSAAAWMKLPGIVRARDISICCMRTPGWQGALKQLDGGIPIPGTPHGGDISSCERGGIGEYPGALIPARSAAAGGFPGWRRRNYGAGWTRPYDERI
jgi:hypothetical protein